MNNRWIVFIVAILIAGLLFALFSFNVESIQEHFVDFKSLKKELGQQSCDILWSQDLLPSNKVTANSYLSSKRISKWKKEGGDGGTSCYILNDIKDRESDPILAGRDCSTMFSNVPFISNSRIDNSRQTTTTVHADACVFDIDPKKATSSNLNQFWNDNIAVYDECIQANAYIIAIYDELLKEKAIAVTTLSNVTNEVRVISDQKNSLIATISNIENNIGSSNVILQKLTNTRDQLLIELLKLRNVYGQSQTNLATFSNDATNYLRSTKQYVAELQTSSDAYAVQVSDSFNTYNNKYTTYTTLLDAYNSIVKIFITLNDQYKSLYADYMTNLQNMEMTTQQLHTCTNNLNYVTKQLSDTQSKYNNMFDKNNIVAENLQLCGAASSYCQTQLAICQKNCQGLTDSITNYTNLYGDCKNNLVTCGVNNTNLVESIKNMNLYFDWVRSVYIYLSCDGFNKSVSESSNLLKEMKTACSNANSDITSVKEEINSIYSRSQSNAQNSLQSCETSVKSTRDDINSKIFPNNVWINDVQLSCSPGEICPTRNQNEADITGPKMCSSMFPGSSYTGKFINYDGQRGAVHCSYWGDSKLAQQATASNKILETNAGNVLPSGSYQTSFPNTCKAQNYILSCPGVKPYNFKNCASNINAIIDPDQNVMKLACRPDGYDYLVSSIATCDQGQTCTFGNGGITTTDANEMMGFCTKYPMQTKTTYNNIVANCYGNNFILISQVPYLNVSRGTFTINNSPALTSTNAVKLQLSMATSDMIYNADSSQILVQNGGPIFNALSQAKIFLITPTTFPENQSQLLTCSGPAGVININSINVDVSVIFLNGFFINIQSYVGASFSTFVSSPGDKSIYFQFPYSNQTYSTTGYCNRTCHGMKTLAEYMNSVSSKDIGKIALFLRQKGPPDLFSNGWNSSKYKFVMCDIDTKSDNNISNIDFFNINIYGQSTIKWAIDTNGKPATLPSNISNMKSGNHTYFNFTGDWQTPQIGPATIMHDAREPNSVAYTMINYTPTYKITNTTLSITTSVPPLMPELQPSGKTIALNDGRRGVYCSYWGLESTQSNAIAYNRNIEQQAYNMQK